MLTSLKKGDWVRAVEKTPTKYERGHIIEGQAGNDIFLGSSAILTIWLTSEINTQINVNFFDVQIIRLNLLPYDQSNHNPGDNQ